MIAVFEASSESEAQEPPPGARVTPAVGAPVLPLIAETNRAPPVERTLNWFWAVEAKSKLLESAHTNAPLWFDFACLPAAKLSAALAVLFVPPGTTDCGPLAVLKIPPPTVALLPLARLSTPPATVPKFTGLIAAASPTSLPPPPPTVP